MMYLRCSNCGKYFLSWRENIRAGGGIEILECLCERLFGPRGLICC